MCGLVCNLYWKTFYAHLKKVCILLVLDAVFCRYLLSPTSLFCHLISVIFLIFCLYVLCIDLSGVLKSPPVTVLFSVSPFMILTVCFVYLHGSVEGIFMLMNIISHSFIYIFIIVFCIYLSFVISFVLKSIFFWYEYHCSHFLIISIFIKFIFPSPHFHSVYLFSPEVNLW